MHNCFITPNSFLFLVSLYHLFPSSFKSLANTVFLCLFIFYCLYGFSFQQCCIVGITQYGNFSDWHHSHSNMNSRFLHNFLQFASSRIFIAGIYHNLFTLLYFEGHLGCFQFGASMNKHVYEPFFMYINFLCNQVNS